MNVLKGLYRAIKIILNVLFAMQMFLFIDEKSLNKIKKKKKK